MPGGDPRYLDRCPYILYASSLCEDTDVLASFSGLGSDIHLKPVPDAPSDA